MVSSRPPRLDRRRLLKNASAATIGVSFAAAPVVHYKAAAKQDITLTWMSNQRHDRAVKEDLFARYAEETGVTVEMNIFADEYPDQLQLAFESGTPPDMFNMNQPRQQIAAGWVEPLTSLVDAEPGMRESFIPNAFVENAGLWDGDIYGLPMYAQTMRLYYNRRIFEEAGLDPDGPPTTWSEMLSFAQQISENTSAYGFIFGDKFPWVWEMNVEFLANGAAAYKFDRVNNAYDFTQQPTKDLINLYIEMENSGALFPGVHTLTDDDARQQFSIGMAGMIIGGSWNPGVFNDQFESTEDWTTAYLPEPDGGRTGRTRQYIGDWYTYSAMSEHKEECWEFLKWLYSPEIMKEMYELGMGVMGVAEANTGESEVRGISLLAPTENDLILPPEPELPQQTPDWVTVYQTIFDQPETMDQALQDLTDQYNAAYEQAAADGLIDEEEYVVPDWDPLTWQPDV